jgi:glycosyltransferase involved in cell wall biosynthesis
MELTNEKLRIAILASAYDDSLSYIENVFAREAAKMGAEVKVFTTPGGSEPPSKTIKVIRLQRSLKFGKTVVPRDPGILELIQNFAPHAALLFAPLQGVGYFLHKHLPPNCRVGAWFSDIPKHRENKWLSRYIKARWARILFNNVHRVYSSTPQTSALLRSWDKIGHLAKKLRQPGLCYEADSLDQYYPLDKSLEDFFRSHTRVALMLSLIIPGKPLREVKDGLEAFLEQNPDAGLLFVGGSDNESTALLLEHVQSSKHSNQIMVHNKVSNNLIGSLFRRAFCSVWSGVSIGIYHSLYCGCPVLVHRHRGSAEHLVKEGVTGFYYDTFGDLSEKLAVVAASAFDPIEMREIVSFARADMVMPSLIKELLA